MKKIEIVVGSSRGIEKRKKRREDLEKIDDEAGEEEEDAEWDDYRSGSDRHGRRRTAATGAAVPDRSCGLCERQKKKETMGGGATVDI